MPKETQLPTVLMRHFDEPVDVEHMAFPRTFYGSTSSADSPPQHDNCDN
jgi:hypothetical protein